MYCVWFWLVLSSSGAIMKLQWQRTQRSYKASDTSNTFAASMRLCNKRIGKKYTKGDIIPSETAEQKSSKKKEHLIWNCPVRSVRALKIKHEPSLAIVITVYCVVVVMLIIGSIRLSIHVCTLHKQNWKEKSEKKKPVAKRKKINICMRKGCAFLFVYFIIPFGQWSDNNTLLRYV